MKRALALSGVGALVLAGSVLGTAAPAFAHNYLLSSTPEAGSTLTALPESVSVTTNDALLDLAGNAGGFGLLVRDSDGRYYGDGCLEIEDSTLSTGAALGAPGTYSVTWQVVSSDGHPVSDSFEFEWAPGEAVEAASGAATPGDCGGTVDVAPPQTQAAASGTDNSTIYWIGGAVLAVGIAVGLTLLLVRPNREPTKE